MKKLFLLMATGIFLATTTFARDIISRNVNDLPQQARTTLNKYFAKNKVTYIKIDKEMLQSTTYEVKLANGVEINFDSNGKWTEVDGNHLPVPAAFIPQKIQQTVKEMYPEARIIKIEREKRGWEIELSNDLDIRFDTQFNIKKVD